MSYIQDDDASQVRSLKDKLESLQALFLDSQFSVQQENIDSGQSIIPGANPISRGGAGGSGGSGGVADPRFFNIITLTPQTPPTDTDVDSSLANIFQITLDRNIEFDITNPNATKFEMLHIVITQNATGNFTIVWPSSVNGTPTIDLTPLSETTISLYNMADGVWRFVSTKGGIVGVDASQWATFSAVAAVKMVDNAIFLDTAQNQSIIALALANNHIVPVGGAHDFFVNDLVTPKFGITETAVESNVILNLNGNQIQQAKQIEFTGLESLTNPTPGIGMDTVIDNAMIYNVSLTTQTHNFKANGELLAAISRIDTNSGQLTIDSIVAGILQATDQLFLSSASTPSPLLDGAIWRDSGTGIFKARQNSVTEDLIGGGKLIHELIADEPVDITKLTIFDDLGDMLINIGTVGKKIRIREQNATPSIASFGETGIDFNQTVDMNGNPIDNILRAIFDANAVPSTTQNEVAGTSAGLFLGTPNTKKIQFAEQGVVFLEMDKDVINPIIADAIDLGIQTTNPFKDLFLAGQANVLGNLTIGGNVLFSANTTLGFDSGDLINFVGTINSNVNFGDNFITDLSKVEFTDGLGNLVGDIRGVNSTPDILEIKLGSSSDFAITDNGTVIANYDNTLLTWSFQGSNVLKLPQETLISDRTTAPSTPSTGQMSLYCINSGGAQTFKVKFDNGTEKTIETDV